MRKVRLCLLWAIAVGITGCQPKYESEMQLIVEPNATSSPTVDVTSTPTTERIYVPAYQNPVNLNKVPSDRPVRDNEDERSPISPASKPQQVENQTPVTNSSTIPAQSGSCKELRARGITNIDVSINPWASRLDRDNDGVACESN
ncbi:excalibur calcium-binding domain-containing protein [Calothrix sp. CCY 0018]|uniref:excalibur calcium-binding domain-containing protein n=1 Tax=Calothrix sp. CCY 0018 TaxID=3103864 RepID=UPI0039C5D185